MRDKDVIVAISLSPWALAEQAAQGPSGDPWLAKRASECSDIAVALEFGAPRLPPLPSEIVAVVEDMASVCLPVFTEEWVSERFDVIAPAPTIRVSTDLLWSLDDEVQS